jgi:O-antigen/teichoic acid export membrane protein
MRTELDSGASSMARAAAVNLAGSIGAAALGLVFTYVVTQVLPAADIGLFSIGTTLVLLVLIPALLGLDTAVIRFVALGAAVDDERRARAGLQVALAVAAVSSCVATALLWWQAAWISEALFDKPAAADLVRIVAWSLPGLALGRVVAASIRGFGMMGYAARLGVLSRVADIVAALPLLALGFGVEGLAVASVVAAYATLGFGLLYLVRVHPRAFAPVRTDWPIGGMIRFSLPQTLTSVFFFGVARLDLLLLAAFASATEVGIYAIATRLLHPATLISTAIGHMFAPRIAAEDARGDRQTLARMLKRVTYWNTATSIPFFAALMLAPVPLLGVFGDAYANGAAALAVLAAGQLLNTAAGPLGQVINMSGRPYVTMVNNAVVTGLNIGAAFVLIPRHGMLGAALSTGIALTVGNLIKLVQVRVILGMTPFRADSLKTFAAAAAGAAVAAPIAFLPDWPSVLIQAPLALLVVFAVYVQALRLLGLSEEDRALFAAGRARLGRRLGRGS